MPTLIELSWLIPIGPFLAFVLIALAFHHHRRLSHWASLIGIGIALGLSQAVFWSVVNQPGIYHRELLTWFRSGVQAFMLGIYIDPAAALMLFMVPLVCLMIFVYSVGYMHGDTRYSRFFAYISLFATGMLGLVLCDNLLAFFLFWELMGTCSYLLIGFWYEKPSAFKAGLKAFLVTKVGDLFLFLGIALLYAETGTLAYDAIFQEDMLSALVDRTFVSGLPLASVITLLFLGGTIGKSAQFPLHVWLPDAMEGPTPASSLIHAATMVSAGVFLIVRMFPLFVVAGTLPIVAIIGAMTALFSSIIAVTQNDIKRVLAFSTISQLGYMVAALGLGAYVAGLFHLVTHAFFKALLFMGAGSVIHSIEHAYHRMHGHAVPKDQAQKLDPNDMLKMGGLGLRMPGTTLAFLAGSLSLSGFPLITAGFWSKDEILAAAWTADRFVFWTLAIAAGLTAFYVSRQLCLVFLGRPRSEAVIYARENSMVMVLPMVILAVFAVGLGWVGIPADFPLLGRVASGGIHHFLNSTHSAMLHIKSADFQWAPLLLSVTVALMGLVLGWVLYGRPPLRRDDRDPISQGLQTLQLGWLYRLVERQFYLDEMYQFLWVQPSVKFADVFALLDRKALDRLSQWISLGVTGASQGFNVFDRSVLDRIPSSAGSGSVGLSQLAAFLDDHFLDGVIRVLGFVSRVMASLIEFIDVRLIDGFVKILGRATRQVGRRVRDLQSGILSDYLWNAFVTVLLLIAFLILFRRL
jgi:NADH-quinone oxidoreductase subunit L